MFGLRSEVGVIIMLIPSSYVACDPDFAHALQSSHGSYYDHNDVHYHLDGTSQCSQGIALVIAVA